MNDLLTTRQVQDILKIDRITVYRMLQDGRLKGVKIGQQWRFSAREVERFISGEAPEEPPTPALTNMVFPTHCVQTIQDLFSEVSQIGAIAINRDGQAITLFSQPCELYQIIFSSPEGREWIQNSWPFYIEQALNGAREFTDPAGLVFTGSPIQDRGAMVGLFLAGPFYWRNPEPAEQAARLNSLAQTLGLPLAQILQTAQTIRVIDPQQQDQVKAWPASAARAIHSILAERTGFMDRLQKISDLSQIA
jgi:excisionase family DNA binding protein